MSEPARNSRPNGIVRSARAFFAATKTSQSASLFPSECDAMLLVDVLRSYMRAVGKGCLSRSISNPRDTLVLVHESTDVTLSLPTHLLRRFRVYAAKQNRSMTSLLADAIAQMVDQAGESAGARRRILERLRDPPGCLPGGKTTWRREELY